MARGIERYKKVTKSMIIDYNKVTDSKEKERPENIERIEILKKFYYEVDLFNPILKKDNCEMCGRRYNGRFFKYVGYSGTRNSIICKPCVARELFGQKYTSNKIYLFLKSMGVL